jgi:predicted enzyme related to lactoylglutathione lyase
MSGLTVPAVGRIAWIDLTVPDAVGVRDFYRHVVGWGSAEVGMATTATSTCSAPPAVR